MNVLSKAVATIEPGIDDGDTPFGSFHVILSAESKDRDGDVLRSDEWEDLPSWINFDIDHAMSVEKTVGSGVPTIEDDGCLHVRGTYASTDLAQDVRKLVNEKHVRNTSVTFMSTKTEKDGKTVTKRELLNGAFVAVPSNRDAIVLESKAMDVTAKAGARNSANDKKRIQAIHDVAAELGASCAAEESADTGEMDGANKSTSAVEAMGRPQLDEEEFAKAVEEAVEKAKAQIVAAAASPAPPAGAKTTTTYVTKALANSVEDLQARISDALCDIYERANPSAWVYVQATFLDDGGKSGTVVYCLNGDSLSRTFTDDGSQVTLGDKVTDVTIITTIVPEGDGSDNDEKAVEPAAVEAKSVTDAEWDGSASRFTLEQYRASTLIHPAEPSDDKNDYKLPVKEPNGSVNSNAVHAAAGALAGARGGLTGVTAEQKEQAAKTMVGLYRNQLKEDPPDSLLKLAGESPEGDDSKSADPASADTKDVSADAGSADEDPNSLRARALLIELQAQALL